MNDKPDAAAAKNFVSDIEEVIRTTKVHIAAFERDAATFAAEGDKLSANTLLRVVDGLKAIVKDFEDIAGK